MTAVVKVTRSHMAGGSARRVGEVYEIDDRTAAMLVGANKAEYTTKPKPKRGAMNTESASGLVAGKGEKDA